MSDDKFCALRPPPSFSEEEEEEESFPQEGEIEGGGAGDKLLLKRWPKPYRRRGLKKRFQAV